MLSASRHKATDILQNYFFPTDRELLIQHLTAILWKQHTTENQGKTVR